MCFVAGDQFRRAIGVVFHRGDVGNADIEPVIFGKFQFAHVQLTIAFGVQHRHFNRVVPLVKNLLGDKCAVITHWHTPACQPHAVTFRDIAAVDQHGATLQGNIAAFEMVFTIAHQLFNVGNGFIECRQLVFTERIHQP